MKTKFSWLKNWFTVFFHDTCMIPLAWFGAYWLRFNLGKIPSNYLYTALSLLPILIIVQVITYQMFGLYRGVWRFASLPDLVRIIKAVGLTVLLMLLILFLSKQLTDVPRSIFPLYALLLMVFLGGSRFFYRISKYRHEKQGQRVLIIGAGQAGEGIARDFKRDAHKKYYPVGFVDDKTNKKGQEIQGIRVIGKTSDIPEIVKQHAIEMVIIAIPSANSKEMRSIVEYCEKANVLFRTLPGLNDLTSGSIRIEALREVSLADLLGRDPITLDRQHIQHTVKDKIILVSGGGGSIGAEVCRQVAQFSPKKLLIVDQNEFNLYTLELELQKKFPHLDYTIYLTDIADPMTVKKMMMTHQIHTIFHAAAYKQVPLLETQIRTAVKNNIIGTKVLADEAIRAKVEKFVLISTDKAVNPTNIMGATKRGAEIFCQNYSTFSQTHFITVRFGNVLGSAGSVVPLFKNQIQSGGPVTVTHPDITRFFMTIPEATQLILQATAMGKGGEIFVLDMGEPIKIRYLAEQMIILSGLVPGKDIDIEYVGLRPGEKLYEELFHESESLTKTTHEKILQAAYRPRDTMELKNIFNSIVLAYEQDNTENLRSLLHSLVPEYQTTMEILQS